MNAKATKEAIHRNGWTVAGWARRHGFEAATVRGQIDGLLGRRGTRLQVAIEDALKADGLYVEDDQP